MKPLLSQLKKKKVKPVLSQLKKNRNTWEEEGREELPLEKDSFMLSASRLSRLAGEGHRRHRVLFELVSSVPLLPNSRAGKSKNPFPLPPLV